MENQKTLDNNKAGQYVPKKNPNQLTKMKDGKTPISNEEFE
jgi:hypothetical protein